MFNLLDEVFIVRLDETSTISFEKRQQWLHLHKSNR